MDRQTAEPDSAVTGCLREIMDTNSPRTMPICIYHDGVHHHLIMYLIIRCPLCVTFTYVDNFQSWKLCPTCGHAYEVSKAQMYLEVEDHHEAEHIVRQMQKHLHSNKKKDFSAKEKEELRHHYTTALKQRRHHQHPVH